MARIYRLSGDPRGKDAEDHLKEVMKGKEIVDLLSDIVVRAGRAGNTHGAQAMKRSLLKQGLVCNSPLYQLLMKHLHLYTVIDTKSKKTADIKGAFPLSVALTALISVVLNAFRTGGTEAINREILAFGLLPQTRLAQCLKSYLALRGDIDL